MANAYTQIYLHVVFAVKHRRGLIPQKHKEELHKYTSGILRKRGHIPIAVHFMKDHVHLLFGLNVNDKIPDIIREVKKSVTDFINEKGWISDHFEWQSGYGGFACSKRDLPVVAAYVNNQEEHHRSMTFKKEFLGMMEEHEINYDPRYMFNWIEEGADGNEEIQ